MKTYYKVSVSCTGKSYRADDEYQMFDSFTKEFRTIEGIKAYLSDTYGNCKRVKMYQDTAPDTEPYQIGYIYCFNNDDICHTPVQKWRQQDWVEVTRVEEATILICA